MVASAGAGPKPINHKTLTSDNLTAAGKIAQKMRVEDGVREAVASFHHNLPVHALTCDLVPGEVACWYYKKGKKEVKLSD
jgi:sterol 3beta-glucosyltransferase